MLAGPDVPGCFLVSFSLLCDILSIHPVMPLDNPPAFGAEMLEYVEVVHAAGNDGAAEASEAGEGQDPTPPVEGAGEGPNLGNKFTLSLT